VLFFLTEFDEEVNPPKAPEADQFEQGSCQGMPTGMPPGARTSEALAAAQESASP